MVANDATIAATMVTAGKRMLRSLGGILKSTGPALLGIITGTRHYYDLSLPSFDPSRAMLLSMNGAVAKRKIFSNLAPSLSISNYLLW